MFVKQDKKKIAQFGNPTQLNVRPHQVAPIQSKQSAGEMLTQMALSKGLDRGLEKGITFAGEKLGALTEGAKAATAGASTTAGATGAMGALGTAMPYVGMGLLGAKMLGLFSKGGKVGPLAKATYAANGEKIGLEFLNAYNSEDMSKLNPLTKATIRRQAVEQASKLNPEDRAKFVDGLRARGITPDTMYGGNNQGKSILEQLFGIK